MSAEIAKADALVAAEIRKALNTRDTSTDAARIYAVCYLTGYLMADFPEVAKALEPLTGIKAVE